MCGVCVCSLDQFWHKLQTCVLCLCFHVCVMCVWLCCMVVQTKGGDVFVEQNEPVKVAEFTDRLTELFVCACIVCCV